MLDLIGDLEPTPPRKRRKTEEDSGSAVSWFGQSNAAKDSGVGPLLRFFQATDPHGSSISLKLPDPKVLPAGEVTGELSSKSKNKHLVHEKSTEQPGLDSTGRALSQQPETTPITIKAKQKPKKKNLRVITGPIESLDPRSLCLTPPPRVRVRSSSAYPEIKDINMAYTSVASQFDQRRRMNSQPAIFHHAGLSSHSPLSQASGSGSARRAYDESPRTSDNHSFESSSDRVPLLQWSRRLHSRPTSSRSMKRETECLETEEGVSETLQHIGKCKGLWFMVIAILVGIFLILFLYAFHIIR